MDRLFYCYSRPLKRFLMKNGEFYIKSDISVSTNKDFWIFNGTTKLNDLLTEWRNNRIVRDKD